MISFPWDSIVERMEDGYPIYDRAYSAQQWWDIYKTFFSNGVFATPTRQFEVSADMGMLLQVQPGYCNINGCFGTEKSTRNVAINLGRNLPRIDTVVLRFDANVEARSIELFVIEGEESESPKRPALTRTETVYELGIADVYVGANATSLSNTNITDTRAETARCGYVNPLFNVDTTGWFEQVQNTLIQMSSELEKQTETAVQLAKDILEGTVESAFQNQLNELNDRQDKFNDATTGLNLICGSRDFNLGHNVYKGTIFYTDGFSNSPNFTIKKDEESGFAVASMLDNANSRGITSQVIPLKSNDTKFTISFEIKCASNSTTSTNILQIRTFSSAGAQKNSFYVTSGLSGVNPIQANEWTSVKYVYNHSIAISDGDVIVVTLLSIIGNETSFRKLMVQRGLINNPIWAPAPGELVLEPNNDMTTGINLLRGTRDFTVGKTNLQQNRYDDGWNIIGTIPKLSGDGFYYFESSSTSQSAYSSKGFQITGNQDLTVSLEVMFTNTSGLTSSTKIFELAAYERTSFSGTLAGRIWPYTLADAGIDISDIKPNEWYKVVISQQNTYDFTDGAVSVLLRNFSNVAGSICYKKVCVQVGSIVNPIWSPSPFDNMNSSAELFSGILPLAKGGTGLTSSPSMLVNLASTSAQNVLQSQPRPGVNGVLQPANGGTGQSSLQATRNAMGLGNTLGALPVDKGGTGATDAATARKNLGVEQISALSAWPVGSIYLSSDPTSPGELFGGTWTQLPTGKVLQTGASFQAGGSTSTSANHSHSLGSAYGKFEMNVDNPKRMYYTWKNSPSYSANYYMNITDTIYSGGKSLSTGMEIGGSTNNAETTAGYPYQNVYAWRRTK